MKWSVIYAIERETEIEADNLNVLFEKADRERKGEEKIVSVKLKR